MLNISIIYKLTDNIIDSIKPYIKDKSNDELEIVKYGLNLFFMELYKLPIVFGLAYYLRIFKYCFLSYILLGFIRNHANGIHMRSGKGCLFYSTIALFSIVYISKTLLLNWIFKVFISLLAIYLIYKYAPADTEEKPILNLDTRKRKKNVFTFIGFLYILIYFIFPDKVIGNIFLFILILECVMINPLTYKLFNQRYNNYEYY